ncbi:class F sortase [Parenemella sanctibonifatiensis]|uniref:class F sortase n=1 Tax=Parenemella sanctibonifatiensis TaxID=2016505 RepID=UPI001E50AC8C|nr:class F sortase [Parenemella sanctibonifatiensis]
MNATELWQRKGVRIGTGVGVIVICLALALGWFLTQNNNQPSTLPPPPTTTDTPSTSAPAPTPTAEQPEPSTPPAPAPTEEPSGPPEGCTVGEINNPKRFIVEDRGVNSPVLSLGLDENGAAAAPPKNASHTVGWYNGGPKVGSEQGNVVLTIHTYRNGGALGNALEDGLLKAGDRIEMTGSDGTTVCYDFREMVHLKVSDYDPDSNVLYSNSGDPQLAIVICTDFNNSTGEWDARYILYADLVTD